MSGPVFTLLILALAVTLGVLFLGLFSMARGGDFNRKYGNLFMRFRVVAQLVAVLLLVLLVFLMNR